MTFIITLWTREGIVMASDSRMMLSHEETVNGVRVKHAGIVFTDACYKTFLAPGNVGISFAGQATIEGAPVSGFVDTFVEDHLPPGGCGPEETALALSKYLASVAPGLETFFLVSGYEKTPGGDPQPRVLDFRASDGVVDCLGEHADAATWRGETDVLSRLLSDVGVQDGEGGFRPYPPTRIPWRFFTLQEAIDFADYAVRVTADTMRFQLRAATVGGPVDILVLKPHEAFWVQRKKLVGPAMR